MMKRIPAVVLVIMATAGTECPSNSIGYVLDKRFDGNWVIDFEAGGFHCMEILENRPFRIMYSASGEPPCQNQAFNTLADYVYIDGDEISFEYGFRSAGGPFDFTYVGTLSGDNRCDGIQSVYRVINGVREPNAFLVTAFSMSR